MNDDSRKRLTGFVDGPVNYDFCKRAGLIRTFLTWADLGAVMDALVKAGKWKAFLKYAFNASSKDEEMAMFSDEDAAGESCFYDEDFIAWLFRPTVDGGAHFCQLCADFLKEGL